MSNSEDKTTKDESGLLAALKASVAVNDYTWERFGLIKARQVADICRKVIEQAEERSETNVST